MTLELPLLTLGLAGFTGEQQQAVEAMLARGVSEATQWKPSELDAADAWWLHGARTQALGGDRIRIASGVKGGRSIQLHLPDVDRPLGFARPLPQGFVAQSSFDLADAASMKAVLRQFEAWLAPITAQFCLAEHIVEHQSALAAGTYELRLGPQLLAVVDMQGEAAVRATLTATDFEGAAWHRSGGGAMPEHFARTSLAQLMWQYTVRTQRDMLPRHYRTGLLYFRRAPHLPQRLLTNSHLLIMRELMIAPATFEELQQRCGFPEARLARKLASLYFVGSITSNPKRAVRTTRAGAEPSALRSQLDSMVPSELPQSRRPQGIDLTAPAPLRPDH